MALAEEDDKETRKSFPVKKSRPLQLKAQSLKVSDRSMAAQELDWDSLLNNMKTFDLNKLIYYFKKYHMI